MLYARYVDTFSEKMFRLTISTKKLNKLHKSVKFTYELGGNELPFLVIKIKLTTEDIITKVYKKEIHTDVVLNVSAITQIKWEKALILWFLIRAKIIASMM